MVCGWLLQKFYNKPLSSELSAPPFSHNLSLMDDQEILPYLHRAADTDLRLSRLAVLYLHAHLVTIQPLFHNATELHSAVSSAWANACMELGFLGLSTKVHESTAALGLVCCFYIHCPLCTDTYFNIVQCQEDIYHFYNDLQMYARKLIRTHLTSMTL